MNQRDCRRAVDSAGTAIAGAVLASKSRWEKAKDAIQAICQKPKNNRWYACAAACQGNGAPMGADWLVGWSNKDCGDATRQAKSEAALMGQTYGRHCACVDTEGFRGTGHQCEDHSR
jgi:hypothetical protein